MVRNLISGPAFRRVITVLTLPVRRVPLIPSVKIVVLPPRVHTRRPKVVKTVYGSSTKFVRMSRLPPVEIQKLRCRRLGPGSAQRCNV